MAAASVGGGYQSWRRLLAITVGVTAVAFVGQLLAVGLWMPAVELSPVWLLGGILLGALLLAELRWWPALVLIGCGSSGFVLWALRGVSAVDVLALALAAGLQSIVVAGGLRITLRGKHPFDSLRDFFVYLLVAVVGGGLLGPTLFLLACMVTGIRPVTFDVWRIYLLSVMLAYLVVTPVVVMSFRRIGLPVQWRGPVYWAEGIFLGLVLTWSCAFVFTSGMRLQVTWSVLAIMAPILLLWAAARFGVLAVSLALLAVTVISTLSTVRGLGPFTALSPVANTLSLQLFVLGGGLSFIALAVVLAERRENSAALESARERLTRLNRELIAAREAEAGRISRELHDDVGQRIALISIGLSRLRNEEQAPKQVEHITHLQGQLSTVVRSIREVSHRLHPTSLEHVGLSNAIEEQCEEIRRATGLRVELRADGDSRLLPPAIARCLFRVAQEALNNVLRHAAAQRIDLALIRDNGTVNLVVRDDGRGLPGGRAPQAGGVGLLSMAERVASLGGVLSVNGPPGLGTTVRVTLPVAESSDA